MLKKNYPGQKPPYLSPEFLEACRITNFHLFAPKVVPNDVSLRALSETMLG